MAMAAEHIRFAKDLAEPLKIKDFQAYYAGALYPDTRYMTKIDRALTHASPAPQDPFKEGLSDFEKGWGTHILYDQVGGDMLKAIVKESGEEFWVAMTAAKIIEDMKAVEVLKEKIAVVNDLAYTAPLRDEPLEELNSYLEGVRQLYKSEPGLKEYTVFAKALGIPEEIIEQIFALIEKFTSDERVRTSILGLHEKTLRIIMKAHPYERTS
jgi:hypothetical protein